MGCLGWEGVGRDGEGRNLRDAETGVLRENGFWQHKPRKMMLPGRMEDRRNLEARPKSTRRLPLALCWVSRAWHTFAAYSGIQTGVESSSWWCSRRYAQTFNA